MLSYLWPLFLVIISNTVYNICAKSTPQNIQPFASLTLTYLVIITACQILFIGGILLFNEKLAALLKTRGLKQAGALTAKKMAKPLSTVFGALIVLGLALMAVYGIKPAAFLGRIVALSGLISFVSIFGVLRIMLSCLNTLKTGK